MGRARAAGFSPAFRAIASSRSSCVDFQRMAVLRASIDSVS